MLRKYSYFVSTHRRCINLFLFPRTKRSPSVSVVVVGKYPYITSILLGNTYIILYFYLSLGLTPSISCFFRRVILRHAWSVRSWTMVMNTLVTPADLSSHRWPIGATELYLAPCSCTWEEPPRGQQGLVKRKQPKISPKQSPNNA